MKELILDYEIIEKVGEGTFAEVYKAQKGGGFFALKILKTTPGMDPEKLISSLRYEFWVLKDLAHPHIVSPIDFGQLPDGRLYLVCEFLDGLPLDTFIKNRSFKECEPLFISLLSALVELERRQIVHGDIKPSNIIVVDSIHPKLIDFGMAHFKKGDLENIVIQSQAGPAARHPHRAHKFRAVGGPHSRHPPVTETLLENRNQATVGENPLGGTPATVAPEIILKQNADHRADLYSLGVCFYSALTGKNPFVGKNIQETLLNHLLKKPEPIGLFRNDIPPPWGALINQMMAKNPFDRPSSPLKALSLVRRGKFILTPTPFVGRKKELKEALEWFSGATDNLKREDKLALVVHGPEGIGVSRFLREVFYQWIAQNPHRRNEIALVENERQAPPVTEAFLPQAKILLIDRMNPPKNYKSLLLTLSPFGFEDVSRWLSLALGLKNPPEKFVEKIKNLTGGFPRVIWDLLTLLSEKNLLSDSTGNVNSSKLLLIDWNSLLPGGKKEEDLQENFEWNLDTVRKKVQNRQVLEDDPCWKKLGPLTGSGLDASNQNFIAERLLRRGHVLALQGEALIDEGKFDKAKESLSTAYEIFKNTPQALVPQIRTRNFLAYILLRQGKTEQAIAEFEQGLKDVQEKLKPDEANQITNLDLGSAYLKAGRLDEAIKQLLKELEFHRQQQGDHKNRMNINHVVANHVVASHEMGCLYNLAQAHAGLNDFKNAESYFGEVLKKAHEEGDFAFTLRAHNGMGNISGSTDRWRSALDHYSQALEVALAVNDYLASAVAIQNRGSIKGKHGLYQEAIADLLDSIKFTEKISLHYAFEKTVIQRSHVELGETYLSQNRLTEARDHLDKAWNAAENDPDLYPFRFWVLLSRCRLWIHLKESAILKKETALLNFYTDEPSKKEKLAELKKEMATVEPSLKPVKSAQGNPLDIILQLNRDLVGEMSLEELLRRILGHALSLSGAELGVILLADDKNRLYPRLSLNAELDSALSHISLSVANQVLLKGEAVTTADAIADSEFNQYESVMHLNLRSIIGLPMIFHGKILGVLYLSHRYRPAVFNEEITRLLSTFADQASLSLTNHKLLNFYKASQEELKNELEETRSDLTMFKEKMRSLPERIRRQIMEGPFKTRSPLMENIFRDVERVAPSGVSVVIHGETGSGKELLSRYIHQNSSRKKKSFTAINCGALPPTLLESELFGHVRGAFTGADRDKMGIIEASDGGTLFLDEVSDLTPEAQVKLLRVLQEKEIQRLGSTQKRTVDIRVICASHKPLREALREHKFREDLYYRLSGFEVTLPPLRERPEDIPLLAEHFLELLRKESPRKSPQKIGSSFMRLLIRYNWPGNVRELKNIIETSAVLSEGKILGLEALPKYLRERLENSTRLKKGGGVHPAEGESGWHHPGKTWKEHELMIYQSALLALDFNVSRTALSLKVGIATVYKWMRENRLSETRDEWKKNIPSYTEGTSLSKIRASVFAQSAKRHPGHPYHAAQTLAVAPVTFYRWSRVP